MFGNIIKDLYIGKSKLNFILNNKELDQKVCFGEILLPTGFQGKMPDYGNYGCFMDGRFTITPVHPKYAFYVTGIPKGEILDNFRLEQTKWSSYYEDNYRGYLFQIIPITEPKLIIDGSN